MIIMGPSSVNCLPSSKFRVLTVDFPVLVDTLNWRSLKADTSSCTLPCIDHVCKHSFRIEAWSTPDARQLWFWDYISSTHLRLWASLGIVSCFIGTPGRIYVLLKAPPHQESPDIKISTRARRMPVRLVLVFISFSDFSTFSDNCGWLCGSGGITAVIPISLCGRYVVLPQVRRLRLRQGLR